jgi:hypothetical protein
METAMPATIRKTLLNIETTLIEGGRAAPRPLKFISAAAVIKNPWAGRGFVEYLKPEIHDDQAILSLELGPQSIGCISQILPR